LKVDWGEKCYLVKNQLTKVRSSWYGDWEKRKRILKNMTQLKASMKLSRKEKEWNYCIIQKMVVSLHIFSESCWFQNLLLELQCFIPKATLVYCDNVSAVYL
jgi:hypothetical protein